MRVVLAAAIIVGIAGDAFAATDLRSEIDVVLDSCMQQYREHPQVSRVERVKCVNDGFTQAYVAFRFPYMDLVYQFEIAQLGSAADADAGRITQEEFSREVNLSMQLFNAAVSSRAQSDQQALDAQAQQQRTQYDAQRKAAIAAAVMSGMFRPQPMQPYVMPTNPNLNCTSVQAGTITSTQCH